MYLNIFKSHHGEECDCGFEVQLCSGSVSVPYLGERPPWEQLVGEVSGLLRLLGGRGGVRPAELLGDTCKSHNWL